MGPLPSPLNEYTLVFVDYVRKWVEATTCQKNDAQIVIIFLRDKFLFDLEFQEFSLVMEGYIFAMLNWQRFFHTMR